MEQVLLLFLGGGGPGPLIAPTALLTYLVVGRVYLSFACPLAVQEECDLSVWCTQGCSEYVLCCYI